MDDSGAGKDVIENWVLEFDYDERCDRPKLRIIDREKTKGKTVLVADLAEAPDIVVRPCMPDQYPWIDLDKALGFWLPNLWGRVDPAERCRQEAHKAQLLKQAGELIAFKYMESRKSRSAQWGGPKRARRIQHG